LRKVKNNKDRVFYFQEDLTQDAEDKEEAFTKK
jgi:hypothetical protein